MDHLAGLNPAQRDAVLQTEGPVMIIAGAGSGKTRVLTQRIAHLIQKGVDPFNILVLTFTNKAAKEMRERIAKVVGAKAKSLWMGTFHSIFAKILRFESEKIGYTSDFTIYDSDDSKSLIRSIVRELNLDDKIYKANIVLNRISAAKNRLVSARDYLKNPDYLADDMHAQRPEIGRIYKIYQERCFKSGAMDFDDLLFNMSVLLRDFPGVTNKYQNIFHYVMVDEFQDTNITQYYITRKLAARRQNICVVGDDAQSIYAFRGADIQNILNFKKDYTDLQIFKLEQNYRSTNVIVEAANEIIKNNIDQLQKNVFTDNERGDIIELMAANSDNDEGKMVANNIFERQMQFQQKFSDFAILYRTNAQSRPMEEALRRLNIPYKIFGGLSFYQRKEIKDVLAYLRLVINPNDEEAFKRVINYPKRGIGDSSIAKIFVFASEQNISLWETLNISHQYLPSRTANLLDSFVSLLKSFRIGLQTRDAYEIANQVAKETGISRELYSDKSIEGLARYENIQELLNGIKEFVEDPEREDKTLSGFLQEVALLTDADKKEEESTDYVTLMTIHSSKGLEFKNVYLVGMEEELFPSQMMLGSRADLEEERRLFYVAVTRAEKNLTLSYALSRYRFGTLKTCEPSRFITEIPPHLMLNPKKSVPKPSNPNEVPFSNSYQNLLSNYQNQKKSVQKPAPTIHKSDPNFVPSDSSLLKEGQTVEHQAFGKGIIIELDNRGNNKKAIVNFEKQGTKTLLLSFAKLRIIS